MRHEDIDINVKGVWKFGALGLFLTVLGWAFYLGLIAAVLLIVKAIFF